VVSPLLLPRVVLKNHTEKKLVDLSRPAAMLARARPRTSKKKKGDPSDGENGALAAQHLIKTGSEQHQ
jgi:hypothetical protein